MSTLRRCEAALDAPSAGRRAVVVFEDRADSIPLRLLRRGFRHCFCAVGAGSAWTVCDPLKTRIELTPVFGILELELASHLTGAGRTVLLGDVEGKQEPQPLRLRAVSCVEIVKRALAIDLSSVVTPYQLCRALLDPPPFRRAFVPYIDAQIPD
jgi:hypothetical protein